MKNNTHAAQHPETPRFLTVAEVAELLRLKPRKLSEDNQPSDFDHLRADAFVIPALTDEELEAEAMRVEACSQLCEVE